jgi:hypothetical protein
MIDDLKLLISLSQKYKWATGDTRALLEKHGVNLVRTDFYSESPTLEDIDNSFEYVNSTGIGDSEAVFDDVNIFKLDDIKKYASELCTFSAKFNPAVDKTNNFFYWKNSQFSNNDAMALYSIIQKEKPKTIFEIGSGFSTHVSHLSIKDLNDNCNLICIDPEPRTDITNIPGITFKKISIQSVTPSDINSLLMPGDILFYDGSHSLKTGSDTVYFYLKILPYLKSGIFVHVHDVRLPFPRNKKALTEAKLYWGEQYILMAHLHNTLRYEVFFASDLLARRGGDILKRMMCNKFPSGGVSLWFKIL